MRWRRSRISGSRVCADHLPDVGALVLAEGRAAAERHVVGHDDLTAHERPHPVGARASVGDLGPVEAVGLVGVIAEGLASRSPRIGRAGRPIRSRSSVGLPGDRLALLGPHPRRAHERREAAHLVRAVLGDLDPRSLAHAHRPACARPIRAGPYRRCRGFGQPPGNVRGPGYTPNACSTDLNPEQLAAATHGEGPLLIVAGPAPARRRRWPPGSPICSSVGYAPERILLLTFSRRAAREMLSRAGRSSGHPDATRVWGGTFHAVANRLLRLHGRALGLRRTSRCSIRPTPPT